MSLSQWPALNAVLNATSAILLACGFYFIRRQRRAAHRHCMIAAFGVSTLFLISYLAYHAFAGTTKYTGTGWLRPLYFSILISHSCLAVVIVPLILTTLHRARQQEFDRHKALARWTWPLWMYVSVTGVVIYLMLYQF